MDSNGTRFVLLKDPEDFGTSSPDCRWNASAGALTLARRDELRLPHPTVEQARELWQRERPYVADDFGVLGRVAPEGGRFEWLEAGARQWRPVLAASEAAAAGSAAALELAPVTPPPGTAFTDLHLGGSGLAALPFSGARHGLLLVHLGGRWQASCLLPFAPVRGWVDAQDRVWVAGEQELGLCRGRPLPFPYQPRDDRFEPLRLNPDPPRLVGSIPLPPHAGVTALAADRELLALLVRQAGLSQLQRLLVRPLSLQAGVPWVEYELPAGLPPATDIALLGGRRVLLLVPFDEGEARGRMSDAPLLYLPEGPSPQRAELLPERWPRRGEAAVRFVRHRDNGPRALGEEGIQPLFRLAQARYPHRGTAEFGRPLDSGTPGTVWHRLYLEGCLPEGCRVLVEAQAVEAWEERPERWEPQPEPAWVPMYSELPFARPPLEPVRGRQGLFEVLLQRGDGEVRELAGRYLRLRLTLSGDGRHTPALHAIRIWYPRFSWQGHYLPPHFHQQVAAGAAPQGAANGADLRERLLAVFEGVLTPLEDRIAAAETLLYPDAAPEPALPWLASFTATPLPPHWPEGRRRRWLAAQGELQRCKGTFGALCRGLDLATDGGVARGEVVPVEMFRLRRTFATILGISMDDSRHPLTLGTGQSGNSMVGESLILSDQQAREFLALLAPELSGAEAETAQEFFQSCARRLTVMLHGPGRSQRRVVAAALPGLVPAAVQWQLVESEHPFVPGLSPLLGIDSYLEPQPPPGRVRLERTALGRGDLVQNPVALAPEYLQGE